MPSLLQRTQSDRTTLPPQLVIADWTVLWDDCTWPLLLILKGADQECSPIINSSKAFQKKKTINKHGLIKILKLQSSLSHVCHFCHTWFFRLHWTDALCNLLWKMQRLYGLGTGGFAINLHGHFFLFLLSLMICL